MAMPVYGINGAVFKNIRVRTETDFPARTFAQNKKHMEAGGILQFTLDF